MDRTRKIFISIIAITLFIILCATGIIRIPLLCSNKTDTPTPTQQPGPTDKPPTVAPTPIATPTPFPRMTNILIDDFDSSPDSSEPTFQLNRLGGDRGTVNNSILVWGDGQVTTTISPDNSWGGMWMSLNHPIGEGVPINFSAILPAQILPAYQSQIVGVTAVIADGTPNTTFRLELKNIEGQRQWMGEVNLNGGRQIVNFNLPPLGDINEFLWVLDNATAGDYVTLESVTFTSGSQITDTATAAFVWSYGMLLNNWNPATGLIRDKAKDASGQFDAIQATGSLAAATAQAAQLGIVTRADAIQIVNKISDTLLNDLPRHHGLWPHWVQTTSTDKPDIVWGTEWSSIDTVIAAIGLQTAQQSLKLDTSDVEQLLQAINWADLTTDNGISFGYDYDEILFSGTWDTFGGESWLVGLAHASATERVASILHAVPPTANGSGFIDEIVWLFVPPPSQPDYWGNDWNAYRERAADAQIAYYPPESCFGQLRLFGLSAAEAPNPATVNGSPYQAYGVGGQFSSANDGTDSSGSPVIIPHYSAMIASLRPQEAVAMWDWLINNDFFTPLNNVESLTFPTNSNCNPDAAVWNSLKGSWNLSLQTLGWGRYLAQRNGQLPTLWETATTNSYLSAGYFLLASKAIPEPEPTTPLISLPYTRECEYPDAFTVGQTMARADASASVVHGQFGTASEFPWPEQAGYVIYSINSPSIENLYLQLRYSKNSDSSIPILIYIDDEPEPRAELYPKNQGDWEQFAWSESISLGSISGGNHVIKFFTVGQQYGVADLDQFKLSDIP